MNRREVLFVRTGLERGYADSREQAITQANEESLP